MNKTLKITALVLLFAAFIFMGPIGLDAQADFVPITDVPELFGAGSNSINTEDGVSLAILLSNAFTFLISISTVIAFVIIVIAGFQYLTSDIAGNKSAAKERILNAVKGLVLILLTWIIMYTINPATLRFDFLNGVPTIQSGDNTQFLGFSFYEINNEYSLQRKGPFRNIQACNEVRNVIEINYGSQTLPVYKQDLECTSRGAETGDVVHSYIAKYYTEPPQRYLNESFTDGERDFENREFFRFTPETCEKERELLDQRDPQQSIFPTTVMCKMLPISGKYYFEYTYKENVASEVYRSPYFNSEQGLLCNNLLRNAKELKEDYYASISPRCTPKPINEDTDISDVTFYCTNLVRTIDEGDDDGRERCYPTAGQCDAAQKEKLDMTRPKFAIEECSEINP